MIFRLFIIFLGLFFGGFSSVFSAQNVDPSYAFLDPVYEYSTSGAVFETLASSQFQNWTYSLRSPVGYYMKAGLGHEFDVSTVNNDHLYSRYNYFDLSLVNPNGTDSGSYNFGRLYANLGSDAIGTPVSTLLGWYKYKKTGLKYQVVFVSFYNDEEVLMIESDERFFGFLTYNQRSKSSGSPKSVISYNMQSFAFLSNGKYVYNLDNTQIFDGSLGPDFTFGNPFFARPTDQACLTLENGYHWRLCDHDYGSLNTISSSVGYWGLEGTKVYFSDQFGGVMTTGIRRDSSTVSRYHGEWYAGGSWNLNISIPEKTDLLSDFYTIPVKVASMIGSSYSDSGGSGTGSTGGNISKGSYLSTFDNPIPIRPTCEIGLTSSEGLSCFGTWIGYGLDWMKYLFLALTNSFIDIANWIISGFVDIGSAIKSISIPSFSIPSFSSVWDSGETKIVDELIGGSGSTSSGSSTPSFMQSSSFCSGDSIVSADGLVAKLQEIYRMFGYYPIQNDSTICTFSGYKTIHMRSEMTVVDYLVISAFVLAFFGIYGTIGGLRMPSLGAYAIDLTKTVQSEGISSIKKYGLSRTSEIRERQTYLKNSAIAQFRAEGKISKELSFEMEKKKEAYKKFLQSKK